MPRFAANLSTMFTERAFPERFAAAAAAGFTAALALFNTPPGAWAAGERGLAALPGREEDFRRAFGQALGYAEVLRPACLHVMAGRAEGPAARDTYLRNLAWAAGQAGAQRLTIEPINSRDIPGYHVATSADAEAVLDAVNSPNLGLQLDLYHAQIMEGDLTRRLERLVPRIFHVQIAGVPDRHEPDEGEVNYPHLFAALDRLGFEGFVGCEYRPRGRTEDGLGWFRAMQA